MSARSDEESSAWNSKCDGLRQTLQAQELHAENLEKELAMRPSSRQVKNHVPAVISQAALQGNYRLMIRF